MNIFNKLKTNVQKSQQLLTGIIKKYILFSPESKQLTLKKKTVLLFCQQAISRVEQLKSLEPDLSEGLILNPILIPYLYLKENSTNGN